MAKKPLRSRGTQLLQQWRGPMRQAEACKLLDLDPATYCKFEGGLRRPGGRWAAKIEMLTDGAVPAVSWHQPPLTEMGVAAP